MYFFMRGLWFPWHILVFLFFPSSLLLPSSAAGYDLRDSKVFPWLLRDKYSQMPEKTCKQSAVHFEPYQGGVLMFWGFYTSLMGEAHSLPQIEDSQPVHGNSN